MRLRVRLLIFWFGIELLSVCSAQTEPVPPPDTSPETATNSAANSDTATPDANLPSFELKRDDRPITVQQTATDAEGGISVTRGGSECRKNENLSFYYAPNPKRIDTKVDNTRIRSSIVLRTQPKEGGADAQDKAVLSFFGGSLGRNEETLCPQNLKREKSEKVTILKGRTTTEGSSLTYENSRGVGEMVGPVALERRASGDSPALTASSSRLSFNVDDDTQMLKGNVKVESDGRTSGAETLELDEEAGFAILRGKPAWSRNADGRVEGEVIEYDLDSNDVVVTSGVQGTFTLETGGEETSLPSLGSFGGDNSSASSTGSDSTTGTTDNSSGTDTSGTSTDEGDSVTGNGSTY